MDWVLCRQKSLNRYWFVLFWPYLNVEIEGPAKWWSKLVWYVVYCTLFIMSKFLNIIWIYYPLHFAHSADLWIALIFVFIECIIDFVATSSQCVINPYFLVGYKKTCTLTMHIHIIIIDLCIYYIPSSKEPV